MAVNMSGLRRNIKNVAHNYTDVQVKVREATSNDPWGPSSTMMSEIADLTYHVVAFSEIMQMIWKRLNDHGKNWRHVYKALVLLEYLIKTGSEKVAQQCKENIFAIQTLKDFQFIDDNKDQGLNVREKAKALVSLLKDDEKLKNERVRALKAKERFAQSTAGIGSDTVYSSSAEGGQPTGGSPLGSPEADVLKPDLEIARPQTQGEEELQLQLALAMSREEADAEETKKKSDDLRLTLAIQKSKAEDQPEVSAGAAAPSKPATSALLDLADLNFGAPTSDPMPLPHPPTRTAASSSSMDPWSPEKPDPWGGAPVVNDPWMAPPSGPAARASPSYAAFSTSPRAIPNTLTPADPWMPAAAAASVSPANDMNQLTANDPWASAGPPPMGHPPPPTVSPRGWAASPTPILQPRLSPVPPRPTNDPFSPTMEASGGSNGGAMMASSNPWDMSGLEPALTNDLLGDLGQFDGTNTGAKPKSTVGDILGEHSNLVNLDNLVQGKPSSLLTDGNAAKNPFTDQPNPFQAAAAPKPSMNQLMNQPTNTAWPTNNQQSQQPATSPVFNPFF